MSKFQHNDVLFTGDDGQPLEFNVRNTTDKEYLKELIEYGGGFCTQNENAVHLISPGTKVLNVDMGKKLVSSTYIFDCVKMNELLEVNDYVFIISEAHTSDISDEDSGRLLAVRHSTCKSPSKRVSKTISPGVSPIKPRNNETESTTSNLTIPSNSSALPQISSSSSTHSESFVEGSQEKSASVKISSHIYNENAIANLSKTPKILKSPEKLAKWELTDFPQSQSLVSLSKVGCVEPKITKSSASTKSSYHTAISPVLRHSPIKQNKKCEKPLNICKVYFDQDSKKENVSESSTNSSIEIDESIITEPKIFQSSNKDKITDKCEDLSERSVAMEIDESITNVKIDNIIFKSSNKFSENIDKENLSPSKNVPMVIDHSILKNSSLTDISESSKNIPMEMDQSIMGNSPNKRTPSKSPIKQIPSISPIKQTPSKLPGSIKVPESSIVKRNKDLEDYDSAISTKYSETVLTRSPVQTVSSSQPENELDDFDNMLLSKIQKKTTLEEEDNLSQSYTVSSSADAQVTSKPNSADITPEGGKNASLPDSPSVNTNVQLYMKQLEEEMEEILKKKPPFNIHDKITMVKYICCSRRLSPSIVLDSLFTDSLDL